MPGHSPASHRGQGPHSPSDQLPSLDLESQKVTINLCDATARVPAELKRGIQTGNQCPREPGDAWELLPGPKRGSLHPFSRAFSFLSGQTFLPTTHGSSGPVWLWPLCWGAL